MQPLQDMQIRNDPKKGLHDVRSFIGACNFYRRHIHNFTYSSAPLTDLIKKTNPWRWTDKDEACLQKLKKKISSASCFFRECFYSRLACVELRWRMQSIVDSCGCHASKQSDSRDRGLISNLPNLQSPTVLTLSCACISSTVCLDSVATAVVLSSPVV